MEKYTVRFQADNWDEPAQYKVLDTNERVMCRVFVSDYIDQKEEKSEIEQRCEQAHAELAAIEMAMELAAKLEERTQ